MDRRGLIRFISRSSYWLAYIVLAKIILGFVIFLVKGEVLLSEFATLEYYLVLALLTMSIPLSVLEWRMGVNEECISCRCWLEKGSSA